MGRTYLCASDIVKAYSWSRHPNLSQAAFVELLSIECGMLNENLLKTLSVPLVPQGNKAGPRRPVKVTSQTCAIPILGLLWQAKVAQEAESTILTDGIGIYRLGM